MARRAKRPRSGAPAPAARGGRSGGAPRDLGRWAQIAAEALVWALLLVPPFVVRPSLADGFDLPKLMISEALALASLIPLAGRLAAGAAGWRASRAMRAALPAAAVATAGWAFTASPAHTREALADLWIGAACLVAWSAALDPARLRRLLAGLTLPASALAALAIAQFHGLYRPFEFAAGEEGARLGVTSLAGNPGVLADYLVLPALAAQWLLARWWRRRRPAAAAAGAALALCLYALAVTQTVTALAALALGSAALWLAVLPRRRALTALALAGLLLLAAVGLVAPLREKVSATAAELAAGSWGRALEGRTDGWRTAAHMARNEPLTGVGHGAYAAEFADAKLTLADRGAAFFRGQKLPTFANAHNEYLEVAAEWGLPGVLALGWALWVLFGGLRGRLSRAPAVEERGAEGAVPEGVADAGLALGGAVALAVMAAGHFPFRVGLVAFPALLLLAWALAGGDRGAAPAQGEPAAVRRPRRWVAALLAAALVLALAGQIVRAGRRIEANRTLHQVEQVSLMAAGRAPAALFWTHVRLLERARTLDPADSRIPLALGSQYLLLDRPEQAVEAYREALSVAPRPEIYLNLGRAQAAAGDLEGARESFRRAVILDPRQRRLVPPELRPPRNPGRS